MKILHVIPSLDPAAGGPPAVVTRLAAAQAGLGHEVSLFCYRHPGADDRVRKSMESLPNRDRIGMLHADADGRSERFFALRARPILDAAAKEFDIFHFHGVWEVVLLAAASAARRHGTPYVVTPHGMLDPWSLQQRAAKKKLALALFHKRMLNHAAFLHVLNTDERDLLKPLNLTAPTEVIPNGVFLSEVEPLPPRGRFRAKHPELGGDPYILFLSRLHYKKGLDFLADAFALVLKSCPTTRLVIAGPDGGERAPFEARCRTLGTTPRVHIVGPLYGPEKIEAMVDASAFCLPSRQEGFSMAITEALACSLPVVISPACHFPEVEQAGAGYTVGLEAAAIARALVALLSDEPSRLRSGAVGRALVTSRFTWPKIADMCLAAYQHHRPKSQPQPTPA